MAEFIRQDMLQLGAPGRCLIADDILRVLPGDDHDLFEKANPIRDGKIVIDKAATEARENGIVRLLLKEPESVIVLGGALFSAQIGSLFPAQIGEGGSDGLFSPKVGPAVCCEITGGFMKASDALIDPLLVQAAGADRRRRQSCNARNMDNRSRAAAVSEPRKSQSRRGSGDAT